MNPIHILVADDDAGHRQMLATLLGDWGYTVQTAVDGEDAVRRCRNQIFDLVLTDVRMPKLSGHEALEKIKLLRPGMPVLMMTAFSTIEAAVQTIKAGAYDYLTKPLDFDKLKITLRNIFAYTELIRENAALASSLASAALHTNIIGQSEPMRKVLDTIATVAPAEATVLITGESGTGKELVAKALHANSKRAKGPFVALNCAALTETLLESELFGHEKGAFTGADKRHDGRFVQANAGTLFLDEIGEMPLSMQAKLLRVIQEREIQRVGGSQTLPVDVRLLAATNKNLSQEVAAGRFREDLYYRLNVVALPLPPLRERWEDIPLLARHFCAKFAAKNSKTITGISPEALQRLALYAWPGNVRELENVMERAVILLIGDCITEKQLPPHLLPSQEPPAPPVGVAPGTPLEDLEKSAILATLEQTKGNKSETARLLGITRKTLHNKLHRYGIS